MCRAGCSWKWAPLEKKRETWGSVEKVLLRHIIINNTITLLITASNPSVCPPGPCSSRGRGQSRTTLWWARGWGRPSAPTSRWQKVTITAGTLEEIGWIRLREWSQSETYSQALTCLTCTLRRTVHRVVCTPTCGYLLRPAAAGRHYKARSCDAFVIKKTKRQ